MTTPGRTVLDSVYLINFPCPTMDLISVVSLHYMLLEIREQLDSVSWSLRLNAHTALHRLLSIICHLQEDITHPK